MRGKGGKLLLEFAALARWTLRRLATIDDGLKLFPAAFAHILENRHRSLPCARTREAAKLVH